MDSETVIRLAKNSGINVIDSQIAAKLERFAAAVEANYVPQWKPIETAPKDSFSRMYRINGFAVQGFVDATGQLMVQSEISPHWRMARGNPTHWSPLLAALDTKEES